MVIDRGIDPQRMVMIPVTTVQEFRNTEPIKVLDSYLEKSNKKPMMFVLDSLGMLSTTKEVEDTSEGKETRDMTRPSLACVSCVDTETWSCWCSSCRDQSHL